MLSLENLMSWLDSGLFAKSAKKTVLIIDEYDPILFSSRGNISEIINGIKNFDLVIGFSGSEIMDFHK